MNILLWVFPVLAALLYGASGVMKAFMFGKVSQDVPSFGALPKRAWMALGIMELVCVVGLIVPAAFHGQPPLTVVAAMVLAVEGLVFIWVGSHTYTPRTASAGRSWAGSSTSGSAWRTPPATGTRCSSCWSWRRRRRGRLKEGATRYDRR